MSGGIKEIINDEKRNRLFQQRNKYNSFKKTLIYDDRKYNYNEVEEAVERYRDSYK